MSLLTLFRPITHLHLTNRRWLLVGTILIFSGVLSACQSDEPLTTEQLVEQARPSTVLVKALSDGEPVSSGSGWVIDAESGMIATNFHVTAPGQEFSIALDRDGAKRRATLVGAAPCDDIAVLQVNDRRGLRSLPVADQSGLKTGQKVVTLGFPGNVSGSDQLQVTEGIISVKRTKLEAGEGKVRGWADHPNLIQTDAALNPGNSGGPTINDDGDLVGMNTFVGPPGQGYAIGSDRLKTLLPALGQGKSRDWGGFGFIFDSSFLVITSTFPDTAADDQGLLPGEEIWRIDGRTIDNMKDYCDATKSAGARSVKTKILYDPYLINYYDVFDNSGFYFPELNFGE
jgi:S1-C subfamily serine protease